MKAVLLLVALGLPALAAPCQPLASWPTQEWPVQRVDPLAKAAQLRALEELAFTVTGKDEQRLGIRTEGLVIIRDGVLVYEKYARGFDATKRHISWSVAKSISSALAGVAVQQGALSLDDSICKYLSGLREELCAITVKHLLTFGPGLQWQESYERQGYQGSSVISMLLGAGHREQIQFVLDHPLDGPPGSFFLYSTGTAHVLATVAQKALLPAHGADAFWTLLFEKIGMRRVVLEEDPKGGALGGSYIYATPRDYAKFGYLFLNDGCWENQRVLPENWVSASTTVSDVFLKAPRGGETTPAGYMWWLNRAVPEQGLEKPWKDAPDDTYAALGHWGQYVLVIPSEKTIIVRVGDDRNDYLEIGELVRRSLEVAR